MNQSLRSCPRSGFGALTRGAVMLVALGGVALPTAAQTILPPSPVPPLSTPPPWATTAAPLVLRGVTVIDVAAGRRLPNRTVVIAGTRIRTLGPAGQVRLPPGARVVEARGKYLIPGLWDMHLQVGRGDEIIFPLLIANGVTGIHNFDGLAPPLDTLGQWKRAVAEGQRVGPRMIVVGPVVTGDTGESYRQATAMSRGQSPDRIEVHTAAEARRVVDSLKTAGADFIRTYDLNPPLYWVLLAEARRLGIPVGGHPPRTVRDGRILSDSGVRTIDHGAPQVLDPCGGGQPDSAGTSRKFDVAACVALGQRFRRNNTWIIPMPAEIVSWPALHYELTRRYYIKWLNWAPDNSPTPEGRLESLRRLADTAPLYRPPVTTADWAAVWPPRAFVPQFEPQSRYLPMLIGTHTAAGGGPGYPGFSVQHVLVKNVVEMGIPPLVALQAATLNPARALGLTDSLGTVAVGKVADLVLLDADPLVDIWHTTTIRAVVANGRYYDRAALDGLLAEAERAAHSPDRGPSARAPHP